VGVPPVARAAGPVPALRIREITDHERVTLLATLRERAHPHCFACSPVHPAGLRLRFEPTPDGGVAARFDGRERHASYSGTVHGGLVATLIDSAMCNCMFSWGYEAMTAELVVRYRKPVAIGQPVIARARVTRDLHPLFYLEADVTQEGEIRAAATAKFMIQDTA
jgi:uncharacterized protein (TIGR00369 family)